MTTLKKISIDHIFGEKRAICIDWKNGRHQMVVIESDSPEDLSRALIDAGELVRKELANGHI